MDIRTPTDLWRLDARLAALGRGLGVMRQRIGAHLAQLEARGGIHALGFPTLDSYAREALGRSGRWAADARALARRLDRLPALRKALVTGALTTSMVELVARVATPEDEPAWVARATSMTVRAMRVHLRTEGLVAPEDEPSAPRSTIALTVTRVEALAFERARMMVEAVGATRGDGAIEAILAEGLGELLARDPDLDLPSLIGGDDLETLRAERLELSLLREQAEAAAESAVPPEEVDPIDPIYPIDPIDPIDPIIDDIEEPTTEDIAAIDTSLRAAASELATRDVELARLAKRAQELELWRVLRFASFDHYCRERIGLSPTSIATRIALARRIEQLPEVADALGAARIGYESATLVARVAGPTTVHAWVERAAERTVKHLREDIDAVDLIARLEQRDVHRMQPPDADTLTAAQSIERAALRIITGQPRTPINADVSPEQMSGTDDLALPTTTLRLSLSDEVATFWRSLDRLQRHALPGESFVPFLVRAVAKSWAHTATNLIAYADVYARDRWRCASPVCRSRNVTPHHVVFRRAARQPRQPVQHLPPRARAPEPPAGRRRRRSLPLVAIPGLVGLRSSQHVALNKGSSRPPRPFHLECAVMSSPDVSPNFGFLAAHDPLLSQHGTRAERYVFEDPAIALVKLRQMGELFAKLAAAHANIVTSYDTPQIDLIRRLQDAGVVEREVGDLFHSLRKAGNRAVHDNEGDAHDALRQLRVAFRLAVWFQLAFVDPLFVAPIFSPPTPAVAAVSPPPATDASVSQALAEAQAAAAAFAAQLAALQATVAAAPKAAVAAVIQQAQKASANLELDESETRALIDDQLREAGWEADSTTLTWSSGARPTKGRNLAIAEVPTAEGPADYVLFMGLEPLAIVEAKRAIKHVAGSIQQAKRYARGYAKTYGQPAAPAAIPFLFATNGRAFLQQLLELSGIWFLDARRPFNHARALRGWYSPEGLAGLLQQDAAAADALILAEPTHYLGLRDYQISAIKAVEAAVANNQQHILLAMATGTGKTRTALGLIYRFVKSGRFRRVLFMVDRTALGDQTHGVFNEVKLENLQSFTDIYDVKGLGDLAPEPETRLHLATVQGMVKRVLFPSEDSPAPPIDAYDCVIIDECHRGYNLDRELSEAELTFRSEAEYISKYRRVLDHFDATRIGLTATPALHTTDIFGTPVFQYGYRQAVVEGYLVDHRPPVRIHTALSGGGIHWNVGENVTVYDRTSGQLDLFTTPDEIDIEIDGFNTKVVTESFNRVVCEQLAREIDPSLPGKTLVFCATDTHADMVVRLLKDAFDATYGPIADDTVQKITGASDRPLDKIRHFKNERLPNVAVTVDLLTTGIDVPEIVNIVFLRRVKSRILYEQMLGRATRLCRDIGKDFFRIFDAVDLYADMQAWSDMKPVVTTPNITFAQLAEELAAQADHDTNRAVIVDQLRAKLQRKVRRMRQAHSDAFAVVAGQSLTDFMAVIGAGDVAAIAQLLAAHPEVPGYLDGVSTGDGQPVYVSDHDDTFTHTTTGYGNGQERPDDYLEGFKRFVLDNQNDIAALMVVTQRPRDLTRKQLRELTFRLDAAGYSISALRTAWQELTNQDIAASLIGFIRQQALGSPLVPYDDRIAAALKRVLASQPWTAPQRQWLQRIAQQIKVEGVVDKDALDQGQFRSEGGFARLNKVFDGRLEQVLGELHEQLWRDVG